jgi:Trk K+ transport system NAD-binding subunit
VALRHFRIRFAIMVAMLAVGGAMFLLLDREPGGGLRHTLPEAVYYTWALVFGQAPSTFPRHSIVLQVLFFVVPVVGLTVIIEGIVDFALILRERRRFEKSWCITMAASFQHHIILVGFGRLGYRTYLLLRRLGEAVVVIERDATNSFLDEVRRDGSPLLIGDARNEALLEVANVRSAQSIILATNDDLANLEIALDARRFAPSIRVVLRMFDQNMADKVRDGFSIHIAMSQAAISAPVFALSAIERSIVNTCVVGDQLLVMQRWLVRQDSPLVGMSVEGVMRELSFGVVERRPNEGPPMYFPPPDTRLAAEDTLVVQGTLEALQNAQRRDLRVA